MHQCSPCSARSGRAVAVLLGTGDTAVRIGARSR